jgi:hypothetical protein
MESDDALKQSLNYFKSNNVFESFSKSTLLDLRAQRAASHKTRKKHTPHVVTESEGPLKQILYLTWFINEEEQDNDEFCERVPDKFKVLKERIESHVKHYYPICHLNDDYWQMEVEMNPGPPRPPANCSIYTTEGVYIRVVFSFRSM